MTPPAMRCSSPTAGSSIRMRRRCSRPGRREFPTRRRRLKRAATTASGASSAASSGIRPGCRAGCRCRSAAFRAQRGSSGCARRRKSIGIGSRWRMPAAPGVDVHALPLASARLAYAGFPRRQLHAGRRPSYDYDGASHSRTLDMREASIRLQAPSPSWSRPRTAPSRYSGPAKSCSSTFSATLPPLKAGWTRRLVLEARGWCKDMDLYTQRWRDCRAAAGHTRAGRGRAPAPLHHTVRVWTMTPRIEKRQFRWDPIQDPAEASLAIKIAMKPIALVCIPV